MYLTKRIWGQVFDFWVCIHTILGGSIGIYLPPWGQIQLNIFSWKFVHETLIKSVNYYLQTLCQINFGIFCYSFRSLKNVWKFLSQSRISRRHRVKKTKTTNLSWIGRSRWPELNFLSLFSKIWSQCATWVNWKNVNKQPYLRLFT